MTGPDPREAIPPVELVAQRVNHGHNRALGLRLIAMGADWSEFALDHRADLIGNEAAGVLASGPIVALLDMASGCAVLLARGKYEPHATLDLRVDYLRAARPGYTVIGRAECYRLTRRIAFVRGLAHDGDPADPVAHAAGTFMFTNAA